MAVVPERSSHLPLPRLIVFALAGIPISALTSAIAIYLPRHLAANVGITLTAVGSAFAIVRLIDIWVDLMLGLAMDRTHTRIGRFRPWMLASVPVILVPAYVLFIAPAGITMTTLIVWVLLLYLGMSMLSLSHSAWAASLTATYDGRSRIFGAIAALGIVGSILTFLTPVVIGAQGGSDLLAVASIGALIMIATPATVAIVAGSTPERIRPTKAARFSAKDYWRLITRPAMLRIILADLCTALGPGWLSATVLFYLVEARGYTLAQANIMLIISISAGFLGAPLVSRLAIHWSKHRALMLAALGYSASLFAFPFAPRGSLAVGIVIMFGLGFFNVAFAALLRAMTADVSDEVELETGQERAGLLFAITTLTAKIAGAFSIFFTFTVLDSVGFVAKAGAANGAAAIRGLEIASVVGPVGFVALGAVCLTGYPLTAKRHAEIRVALDARDGAGAA